MSFLRQTGITLVARIALVIISFIFNIIISRKLGTSGMDIIAPLQAFALIGVQIGYLGAERGGIYFIGLDKERASVISGTLFSIGIVASLVIYAAMMLVAIVFPTFLGDVGIDLYRLQMISVLPLILSLFAQNILLAYQKIVAYNVIELSVRLANLIATILVFQYVPAEYWIVAMVWLYVGSAYAIGIVNTGFTWATKPFSLTIDFKTARDILGYSWKNYVSALMTFMIVRSDILFLNAYRIGTDEAGIYSRVVYISDLLFTIPMVLGTLLFPKLMQDGASEEKGLDDRGRFTMLLTRLVIFTLFLMWVFFVIIGKWFLGIFGEGFVEGYVPLTILLGGTIFIGAHVILKVELFRRGLPVILVWYSTIGMLVKIIGNWFLVPEYGMLGAAWSSLAVHLLFFWNALWYCNRHYGFSYMDSLFVRKEDFGLLWDRIRNLRKS